MALPRRGSEPFTAPAGASSGVSAESGNGCHSHMKPSRDGKGRRPCMDTSPWEDCDRCRADAVLTRAARRRQSVDSVPDPTDRRSYPQHRGRTAEAAERIAAWLDCLPDSLKESAMAEALCAFGDLDELAAIEPDSAPSPLSSAGVVFVETISHNRCNPSHRRVVQRSRSRFQG